jgi:hypothetical protein
MLEIETQNIDGRQYRVRRSFQACSKDRRRFVIHFFEEDLLDEEIEALPRPVFRTSYGMRVDRITQGHYSIEELDGLDVYCEDPAAP